MGLKYMEPIYQHFKKSCFDASIVNDHIWADNHILVVCAIFCWTFDKVYQNPTYSGPEIAFHCGLGWENVQKSMFYNLNPHCMDKMRELMTKDPPASDLSGGLPATNRLPPMAPMPGFPTPTMTVPRPTVPPSTVTAKPSLPYQSRLPPLTAPGGKAVVPPPPKQYTPYTSAEGLGLRFDAPPSASTSSAARPPASISSPSSTPMPPPNLPQHSQPSTPKASTPSVPPKAAPSAGAPVPPKAAPRTSTSAPMEIDLTQDDEDDEPQIGPNGRPKRKNAGKRRMDDGN
ncbi:hypothetical protein DL93DRAFT_1860160 [Clavulina sp. PMI_390]|nr:hypothetical protein DL93DRAFT_1860160 [Clavulina sp. PMI_390]